MQDTQAFFPLYSPNAGNTAGSLLASVTITGTNASATSAALSGSGSGWSSGFQQIQIANKTSAWAHVNFGQNTTVIVAATVASSYPVAPGAVVVVTVAGEVGAASVILDAAPGTATAVIFTRGMGL